MLDLLSEKQWAAVSAVGTAAQAIIAFLGLAFIGYQILQARKTGDLQSLQEFLRATKEHENALFNTANEDEQNKAFYEFANFLEFQAAALHGKLFSKVTDKIAREKIRDSIATIELIEPWKKKLEAGISSTTTFEHLRKFCKSERQNINNVKAGQEMMKAEEVTENPV